MPSMTRPQRGQPAGRPVPTYQSLQRGLKILEIVQSRGRMRICELSDALDIPLSTVYRYSSVLRESGFIYEVDGYLVAGERLAEHGGPSPHLIQIAAPMLTWLRQETGMSAVLTVRVHTSALCLDVSYAHPKHRISFVRGKAVSLYAGASALPLLAHAPRSVQREVLSGEMRPFTSSTPAPEELDELIRDIRSQGYAVSDSQVTPGMVAFGVPVLIGSMCWCVLSLVGESAQTLHRQAFVEKLQWAAGQLTARLDTEDESINDIWGGAHDAAQ